MYSRTLQSTPLWRVCVEVVPIPLGFAVLVAAWPLVTHGPAPSWALVGLGLYGALAVVALGWEVSKKWTAHRNDRKAAPGPGLVRHP